MEARIDFRARDNPVNASLGLPDVRTPGFELVEEHAASPGYGFSIVEEGGHRRAEWTRREVKGEQSLYYNAQFIVSNEPTVEAPPSRSGTR